MDSAKRRAQLSKMSAKAFQGVVEAAGLTYSAGKRGGMIDAILAKEFPGGPIAPDDSGPTTIDQETGEGKTENEPQSPSGEVDPADITIDDVQVDAPEAPSPEPEPSAEPAPTPTASPTTTKKGKRTKSKPAAAPAKPQKGKSDDKPKETKAPVKGRRGRRPLSEILTPDEKKKEIKELLDQLSKSTSTDEKKSLRRALRLRGHSGGMGVMKVKAEAK